MQKTRAKLADRAMRSVGVLMADYDAVLENTEGIPLPFVKLFTAMRAMWENATPEQRLEAMKQINALAAA